MLLSSWLRLLLALRATGRFSGWRRLFSCCLVLISGPVLAQNQPLIDSLARASASQTDTTKAWTLTRLAWEYRPYNREKALALNRQALALATEAGNVEQQGFCWMALGNVYMFHEQDGPAQQSYQMAEPLLRKAAGPRAAGRLAQLHYNWGLLLQERLSDYAGAVHHLLQAVRAYETLGSYRELTTSLNTIANCLYHEQQMESAFAYYRRAEAAARRSGSLKDQLLVMNDFYSSYLELYRQQRNPAHLRVAIQNLERGVALIRQQASQSVSPQYLPTFLTNLAEAYTWRGDLLRTRQLLRESTALTKPLRITTLLAHNYSILALAEARHQHAALAAAATRQASQYLAACSLDDKATITQRLQLASTELGNWPAAYAHLTQYAAVRDSLAARANFQTMRRLMIQYEVEKKDLNIRALTQQATYHRRLLLLTVGMALLLLAGAAALLYSNRLRRRLAEQHLRLSEQQAVVERQEKRLAQQQQAQLQQEVDYKQRELATTTLSVERKNALLLTLRKELEQVADGSPQFKPAFRLIDKNLQLDDDVDQFCRHFESVHPRFFQHLAAQAQVALSATDLRYCAYLRMGLSTKEIANLLNIEPHSVRVGKHRLKQKLGLGKSVDLEAFMKED
ncbi:helix-turn-helix transcriptional regulator [Hymenobacter rubripertinctus]|uniref:HTH luxR-type domain-containing protein n=1 Tax=Hymenobacter rubripertinctus TaxID=2029981 RepID=A0A418R0U4_9BACT|nr:LuxR C-terminal-related transcriptional regulator [Hymenobacter rubripertinctus]RIY10999.1 hypothetical protein D0T11_08285 [Hymenobacter rubripertinctus]